MLDLLKQALMADGLIAVAEGRSPAGSEDLDAENAALYNEYHDKSWDEVRKLALDTLHEVVARVESLGEQDLTSGARFFPWQTERPLWRLIVGSGYLHPIGHMAEFHRNRGNRVSAGRMIGEMARSMVGLDEGLAWQGEVKCSLACHYSLLEDKVKAIRLLHESLGLNPGLVDSAKEDPDLDDIRDEPEYQAIFKR